MKETKIFYAIRRLETKERSRFQKYLESPYFNTDENLVFLYQFIVSEADKIEQDKIDKESIWKAIRADEKYNDTRFRKYCSDLLKHLEGFLYQEYTRQNKGHEYPFILDALNERRMARLYNSVLRSGRDAISKYPRRDARHHQRKYDIEKRYYDLSQAELIRGEAATTSEIADALDHFYIIEKLRLYCSVLVRRFYLEGDYKLLLIDEIIQTIENSNLKEVPVIEIYYRLTLTYSQPDNLENWEKLKSIVQINHELFEADDLVDIYYGMLNFLARKINVGHKDSLIEFVDIVSYMLNNGVYNAQGELSPWTFRNAILAGLRTEQFDWVYETLERYGSRLPEEYRENALQYNYAQLFFYKKEYGKVLQHLQRVQLDDPAYALNSRNLFLAVYYELGELEALFALMNAFATYLKRQTQLSNSVRTGYRQLLKAIKRLVDTKPGDENRIKEIEKFLNKNPGTVSSQWLRSKVEELRLKQRKW